MTQITITGASDDLIEIDGDIQEEWNPEDDRHRWIGVSDGTLLSVQYDVDGLWRFNPIVRGTAEYLKTEGSVEDDTNDVISLMGDIRWVMFGVDKAILKTANKSKGVQ